MTDYSVAAKAFNTLNRRFKPGDSVNRDDIQGDVGYDEWVAGGFIMGADAFFQIVATIQSGQSVSSSINLQRQRVASIVLPLAWDGAADLTFQVSYDQGATWAEMYQESGVPVQISGDAGRMIPIDQTRFQTVNVMRIRSGTNSNPITQTGQRKIIINYIPVNS